MPNFDVNPYIPILDLLIDFETIFFVNLLFYAAKSVSGAGTAFAKLLKQIIVTVCMRVKAEAIIGWVDTNLPPLTWRIIAMKQMKVLLKHKISPAKIDADTYFNAEIVEAIRAMIKAEYHKELPNVYL